MKVIGLTGGIASGKSTVARLLKNYGFAVVDADVASRQAVAPGTPGLKQVVAAFGEQAVKDGQMDRAYIGQMIFNDAAQRKVLNSIIHPIVRELMENEKQQALAAGQHVIMDIPLLYENGLEDTVDEVWVVYVSEALQQERLMARNQLSADDAHIRIHSQMSIEEKRSRADRVIDNCGTLAQLETAVEQVVTQFLQQ